jgi:hypothetical protein
VQTVRCWHSCQASAQGCEQAQSKGVGGDSVVVLVVAAEMYIVYVVV